MATRITAKVRCNLKQEYGSSAGEYATLGFMPDYGPDSGNDVWANATPHLDLRMTVKGDVGRHFAPGEAYTLTFTQEGN